jgi:cell division protein FtsB
MAARAYAGTGTGTGYRRQRPAPSRRPAARRRPRPRRGGSRVNWDRVGRVALTIVLAAVLFSYLNPAVNFIHSYRGSQEAKARLAELQQETSRLERRVKATRDPGVLEREARRQGMIRPGERAYVIQGLR